MKPAPQKEPEQQAEYIITERQLNSLPYENSVWAKKTSDEIRSRQYNEAAIRRQAQEEEREKTRLETIYELLKFFKFACPGGPVTPICDMCGAAGYCAELRDKSDKEKKEGPA